MTSVLSIEGLSRRFGAVTAVDNLCLAVGAGQTYGILGPNGSGKTTTLGMILGVVGPSSGSYRWFGNKPSAASRRRVGALLEKPNFCPWLSAERNLTLVAAIRRLDRPQAQIADVLRTVKLHEVGRLPFQNFSLGMKQRLAIASALLGAPEVLVLDEPTNGVDAEGIAEIRHTITSIAASGRTIILASHILDEVEKVCSHVVVLKKGRVLDEGPITSVLAHDDAIEVASEDMEGLQRALHDLIKTGGGIKTIERAPTFFRVKIHDDYSVAALNSHLFNQKVVASHLLRRKRSLESHFLEILEKA